MNATRASLEMDWYAHQVKLVTTGAYQYSYALYNVHTSDSEKYKSVSAIEVKSSLIKMLVELFT